MLMIKWLICTIGESRPKVSIGYNYTKLAPRIDLFVSVISMCRQLPRKHLSLSSFR
jgi:hypothetical protein